MTTPVLLSVINQSAKISDADVLKATKALGLQLIRNVAPIWGLVPAVESVPKGKSPSPHGTPLYILDTPDVPNALGYHYETGNGPAGKVFWDPIESSGGGILTGALSLASVLSHEGVELTGDWAANRWADGPGALDYALELADPDQNSSYEIRLNDGTMVAVSNFVYQSYFDPDAKHWDKLDFLGHLKTPFKPGPGGYQIVRSEPGKVSQVFGAMTTSDYEHLLPGNADGMSLLFGADLAADTVKRTSVVNKFLVHNRRKPRT